MIGSTSAGLYKENCGWLNGCGVYKETYYWFNVPRGVNKESYNWLNVCWVKQGDL